MKFLVLLTIVAVAAATPKLGSFRPGSRIVGGSDATKGQYPYQISYQYGLFGAVSHVCGGSIVSPSWIITAGHCVTEVPAFGDYKVVAGILNLDDRDRQIIDVVEKIVHPNYKGGVGPNDIALLRLQTPLKFGDLVQPITLPSAQDVITGEVVLSGWGSTSTTRNPINPNHLQTIDLPLVSNAECKKALDDIIGASQNPVDATSNICTGPLTIAGKGACNGDSGGPLAQNGTLIGVVSWGIVPCGSPGAPSVYTRVTSFIDFITKNVNDLQQ